MKHKWIASFILCLCLVLTAAVYPEAASAESGRSLEIYTAEEFLAFAEACRLDSYSVGLNVSLRADIDLSGSGFEGVPIFCGSFDGGGYSVTGFVLDRAGSAQGLFRYLTADSQVRNLNLCGTVTPGGSRCQVGALVGENSGLISNCTLNITVSGADKVGGLAGENLVKGIIEKCTVSGSVNGAHFVGGIAGSNLGVIRECDNAAAVNTTPQQNTVELSDINVYSITGSEAANTSTDLGGIAGISQGLIRGCTNRGAVGYRQMGYNVGGIAGSQMGYIGGCVNYGDISGRKEVGGIVGQMEPSTYIVFDKDALQILSQQLDGMSATISAAGTEMESSAGQIGFYSSMLANQAGNTGQAIGSIIQGGENMDPDSFTAAQSVLNSGLTEMSYTMQGITAGAMGAVNTLWGTLSSLQSQVDAMRGTISNLSENMGGSIKDVSDDDSIEQFTGKVEGSVNMGRVRGDMNVGGISGAIAVENDLDIMEDFSLGENQSMNFVSELRAVILSCRNSGEIQVNHDAAGGIAGWMQFGLVKDSASTSKVDGSSADYVGGVAGRSSGYIRSCSAKGEIAGNTYAGGIAGQGVTVTDCRSKVIVTGSERTGDILGYGVQDRDDDGQPKLLNNYYLNQNKDIGGIDGISYSNVAQPLVENVFMALPELSDIFMKVNISFVQEDGSTTVVTVDSGSTLPSELVPAPAEKPGYISSWEGLNDRSYDYDTSFRVLYTPISSSIASSEKTEGGLPLLLAEGSFMPGSSLEILPTSGKPQLESNERFVVLLSYKASDGAHAHTLRYHVGEQKRPLIAFVSSEGQDWTECPIKIVGTYAVVEMPEGMDSLAIVRVGMASWQFAAISGGVATGILLLLILWHRSAKRRKNAVSVPEKA